MTYINYTVFADAACTEVRSSHQLYGDKAAAAIRAFKDITGETPKANTLYKELGARIDWISA